MTTTMTEQPAAPMRPLPLGAPGLPAGASHLSKCYYDEQGRRRNAHTSVPVDQFGRIAGVEYTCRRCRTSRWFPVGLKGIPTCDGCDLRMAAVALRRPPLLPWRALWDVVERPLRPVWSLPALAAAGYAVDAAPIPAIALLIAAPVAGELARRISQAQLVKAKVSRGRLEEGDPAGGKRLRAAIARQSRLVGYGAGAGVGWLAAAASLGVDPSTTAGRVALAALGVLWLVPAATWWWRLRGERNRPALAAEPGPAMVTDEPNFGQLIAQRWTETVGATAQPAVLAAKQGSAPVGAAGKLPGTVLQDVHRVTGGWAATVVDPLMRGLEWVNEAVRRNIAAVFGVGIAAVSLEPNMEDANLCFVMVQPNSPLKDVVRWDGPDSVDAQRGVGMAGRYADGTTMFYEVYRPGWGCPHDALFGTTGSGKSEMFCQLMVIDRWMHYVDEDGAARGMVADFLIDPQHGQSFGPFLDDLAAPVASSLDEALLLVAALEGEGLRRNEYLATVKWVDERGRRRKGRKFWDPFVDGPLLVLNIDEAHFFLAVRLFAERITAAARMWRKCGMKVRIATHTPLLTDLGGSMALRDMLTGGFVWVGRTANSLTSGTAFNGQLPVDPRSIPKVPGMSYALAGENPRALLMRSAWEPDYYDWVRDGGDKPIGYPAQLPAVTLAAFGPEYAKWVSARAGEELWVPDSLSAPARQEPSGTAVDAVRSVLLAAPAALDMDEIDRELKQAGTSFATRTVRDALKRLRDLGEVHSGDGRHQVSESLREQLAEVNA